MFSCGWGERVGQERKKAFKKIFLETTPIFVWLKNYSGNCPKSFIASGKSESERERWMIVNHFQNYPPFGVFTGGRGQRDKGQGGQDEFSSGFLRLSSCLSDFCFSLFIITIQCLFDTKRQIEQNTLNSLNYLLS